MKVAVSKPTFDAQRPFQRRHAGRSHAIRGVNLVIFHTSGWAGGGRWRNLIAFKEKTMFKRDL